MRHCAKEKCRRPIEMSSPAGAGAARAGAAATVSRRLGVERAKTAFWELLVGDERQQGAQRPRARRSDAMIAGRLGASRLDEPAVRSAIANLVQKSKQIPPFIRKRSLLSIPHITAHVETLLGVISQVIKDGGWCERHRIPECHIYQTKEVMLAAVFEIVSGEFVLPDDVHTDTLQHLQRVLRAELRELYDPPNERPRLLARRSHLSFHQLAELVAFASLRDSTTLAQTEALLTSVDGMPWDSLPALVVSSIAVHLQGADGLAWCATCHAFRAAQPALRVPFINDVGYLEFIADGGLPGDQLAMIL